MGTETLDSLGTQLPYMVIGYPNFQEFLYPFTIFPLGFCTRFTCKNKPTYHLHQWPAATFQGGTTDTDPYAIRYIIFVR